MFDRKSNRLADHPFRAPLFLKRPFMDPSRVLLIQLSPVQPLPPCSRMSLLSYRRQQDADSHKTQVGKNHQKKTYAFTDINLKIHICICFKNVWFPLIATWSLCRFTLDCNILTTSLCVSPDLVQNIEIVFYKNLIWNETKMKFCQNVGIFFGLSMLYRENQQLFKTITYQDKQKRKKG